MERRVLVESYKVCITFFVLVLTLIFSSCATTPLSSQSSIKGTDVYMGDWQGNLMAANGKRSPLSAQVIALGNGKYQANILEEFDNRIKPTAVLDGTSEGSSIHFKGAGWQGLIKNGKFTGIFGFGSFEMKKVERISPAMGAKGGQGSIVLFDGKNFDQWQADKVGPVKWKIINGAMEVVPKTGSIITKKKFRDYMLHMEFRSPFMPKARGQARGNSGVYHQGLYEVQVLDSYGLEGKDNECGGIYKVAAPRVNMCSPPMQWQSYDIIFKSPRFDSSGSKKANARITVIHNGVMIHDNQELPLPTGGARSNTETGFGPVMLQDHGNKVQYRNIWLVELR